jgi:hypothetical protein
VNDSIAITLPLQFNGNDTKQREKCGMRGTERARLQSRHRQKKKKPTLPPQKRLSTLFCFVSVRLCADVAEPPSFFTSSLGFSARASFFFFFASHLLRRHAYTLNEATSYAALIKKKQKHFSPLFFCALFMKDQQTTTTPTL